MVAFKQGEADLTTLVLDVGSAMEKYDMEDAFVGAWDIANLTSDFLMEKMGAETSGCSTKAPTSLTSSRYDVEGADPWVGCWPSPLFLRQRLLFFCRRGKYVAKAGRNARR